jgi:uncharacterized protein (DUF2236 family)
MATQEPGPGEGQQPPTEEEMQRALEEQLRRVRVQDLLLESVASILNLSARRIAKPDERDLEQGRVGIEAVRAVLDLLEPEAQEQVRQALSQVQMLYARESREGEDEPGGDEGGGGGESPPPRPDPPPGLWVPGSS